MAGMNDLDAGAMKGSDSCDVLIVGYGPVGAVLAGLLAEKNIRVIVVERSLEVYPLPRAAHFDHEIMRVFQRLGIADEALLYARPAPPYEFRAADGSLLMSVRQSSRPSMSGWANAYMFNQPGVERALRAKVAELANVDVRLGAAFVSLDQGADRVSVAVAGPEGESTIDAAFVVGCDGAWSPVREAVGLELEDFRFDEPWLVVDTIPDDPETMPKVNLQICDPARPTTCVAMGPGRHRWEFMMMPGETAETALADGFVESLLESWNVKVSIERKAVYRFHGLVAKSWRASRVLIAGDAAHQMPPFAGQGMCSGVRDAANLAWKLQAILAGDADLALLDTYQAERDPNVRSYIQLAIEMGRVVCTLDPVVAAQRDAGMIAMRESGAEPIPSVVKPGVEGGAFLANDPQAADIFPQPSAESNGATSRLDDVLGKDAWLIERTPGAQALPGVRRIGLDDPIVAPFREVLATWFETHAIAAILVRPDRYIFGTGDGDTLLRYWARAMNMSFAEASP